MNALSTAPAASEKETHATIVRTSLLNQNIKFPCKGALHLVKPIKQLLNK